MGGYWLDHCSLNCQVNQEYKMLADKNLQNLHNLKNSFHSNHNKKIIYRTVCSEPFSENSNLSPPIPIILPEDRRMKEEIQSPLSNQFFPI